MWVLDTLAQIQKLGQTKSGSDRQREVLQLSKSKKSPGIGILRIKNNAQGG
jgi:hypothetical protein